MKKINTASPESSQSAVVPEEQLSASED